VEYRVSPPLDEAAYSALMAAAWGVGPTETDVAARLTRHSLGYICAYRAGGLQGARLIGFVNVAWDGGVHAFLLDTTVHPSERRRGVGRELVRRAVALARERGLAWLHVDCEARHEAFYRRCGFHPTAAGLIRLTEERTED
jgi:ribosomal protein S18 acetylase RimI-like enzyme